MCVCVCVCVCVSLTVQPYCLEGRVVCGTVYGDMHFKDLLGSIVHARVHITYYMAYENMAIWNSYFAANG